MGAFLAGHLPAIALGRLEKMPGLASRLALRDTFYSRFRRDGYHHRCKLAMKNFVV
jgi:hypothetical protein